jgi:hypothetical protein
MKKKFLVTRITKETQYPGKRRKSEKDDPPDPPNQLIQSLFAKGKKSRRD